MSTTVTSPAGDEVRIYDVETFAELIGFEPGQRHSTALLLTPERFAVLDILWRFGAITDKSGRAGSMLSERAGVAHTPGVLRAPAVAACVERVGNTRRVHGLRLVALPEVWLAILDPGTKVGGVSRPAPEAESSDDGLPAHVADSADSAPVEPELAPIEVELANAVATALLAQVVEIISTGGNAHSELRRLQLDVEGLRERLGTQVAYVDRLRRDLRDAGDEIAALKGERDGLRQRLRSTEYNLKAATSGDARRIIDAEVRRQVDRVMREVPNGEHSREQSPRP
jgi:hypothetical protein